MGDITRSKWGTVHMAMRLIDADRLIDEFEDTIGNPISRTRLKLQVQNQPTVDAVQKKGHWVENHDSDHAWKCSECGCGYTDSKLSFCYDCGADMRGEDDGRFNQ